MGLNGLPGVSGPTAVLLACGNSLRQDDGVGLRIAEAAEQLFPASRLRIVAAQQFTPEMAVQLAEAKLAIFVDACLTDEPGAIRISRVAAQQSARGSGAAEAGLEETHRLDPPALLALAKALCGRTPAQAFAITIGVESLGYGEQMTGPLRQAVPRALRLVESLLGCAMQRPKAHE
ncbi:MAG: hydrogenase maturation protease [Acidobacteriaceae bacterium]